MDCLVEINGGIGKSIMFSSIVKELKTIYDAVYITTAYPDVFEACPYVDKVWQSGRDVFSDIVNDDSIRILSLEPYSSEGFIRKREHLFNAWRELYGLPIDESTRGLPAKEHQTLDVKRYIPDVMEQIAPALKQWGKDFIVVQFTGGQSCIAQTPKYNINDEALQRNYKYGQQLVDLIRAKYPKMTIVNYSLPSEPDYEGTVKPSFPTIYWAEIVRYAKAVICIDSSLQHLATGNCRCVNVLWGETQPEHFGYAENNNIKPAKLKLSRPYFRSLGPSPAIVKFASPEDVLASVEKFAQEKGIKL